MKNVIAPRVNYTSPLKINKTYYPISINSETSSFTIVNDGTAAAPCRLSFIPRNDLMSMTITGLSEEDIKLSKIYAGSQVILDGINKNFTIDGIESFQYFDGWEFPKLQPGENFITMTNAEAMTEIDIEFQPRYI